MMKEKLGREKDQKDILLYSFCQTVYFAEAVQEAVLRMDVEVDKRHDASFSDRPSGVVMVVVRNSKAAGKRGVRERKGLRSGDAGSLRGGRILPGITGPRHQESSSGKGVFNGLRIPGEQFLHFLCGADIEVSGLIAHPSCARRAFRQNTGDSIRSITSSWTMS